jgi:hypothetical protein
LDAIVIELVPKEVNLVNGVDLDVAAVGFRLRQISVIVILLPLLSFSPLALPVNNNQLSEVNIALIIRQGIQEAVGNSHQHRGILVHLGVTKTQFDLDLLQ